MTMMDDERREVAARLRGAVADLCAKHDTRLQNGSETFNKAHACAYRNIADALTRAGSMSLDTRGVASLLADLIDPTCAMTDTTWDNGERTWGCVCSACGERIEHEGARYLAHCPRCGARVVRVVRDDG